MLKNIKIYTLLLITLGFMACSTDNEVEPLFDQDVDSRVDALLESYKKTLTDSEFGWKADYRPGNEITGVYNIYFKFNTDNSATIVSDHNNGENDTPTTYRVGKSQFPELVFENHSTLHSLFEAERFRLGAEFEFIIVSVSSDKIELKSKTDQGEDKSTLTLVKATADDKENVEKLQGLDERVKDGHNTTLLFRGITITNSAADLIFSGSFSYDELTRIATVIYEDADNNEKIDELAIELTENGITFVNPVTFAGIEFQVFTYDEVTNTFTSTVDGNTAVIAPSNLPLYINNDILTIGQSASGSRFLYRPALGSNPLTSAGIDAIVAEINTNVAPFGISFNNFILTTDPSVSGNNTVLSVSLPNFTLFYDFEAKIVNKKLILDYKGPSTTQGNAGNNAFIESRIQSLIDFLRSPNPADADPDGLIYTSRGPFRSTTNAFPNEAATFLSTSNPSLSVYGVWF
ncbi:hypothetical protein IWQ47_000035 [Aquimarina sp. EL_43]|uniref:DUF4302 domain-containing protein n=1 Tax=unclassified Aquimarina TaxID=2627091 RepID=UPI0018C8FE72|nr:MULTISPECIES: DUF4302 domain-containing protein [unclassified Aquimarina]MBG6129272.1 hypothetical protein [Aquimarina sp. EL_35]MBG6150337.1 hypothetical protein [Aquimarina sp. EL_32]MBG6166977.1 hypothetical protein [Aquimarina sp. EL_43]